jgi:hypothetical protein
MKNPFRASDADIDAPFYIFGGIRIDRITYYLSACIMTTCVFYGTLKSFQRFLALYAPLFYSENFTKPTTIKICSGIAITIHIGLIPVLFIGSNKRENVEL